MSVGLASFISARHRRRRKKAEDCGGIPGFNELLEAMACSSRSCPRQWRLRPRYVRCTCVKTSDVPPTFGLFATFPGYELHERGGRVHPSAIHVALSSSHGGCEHTHPSNRPARDQFCCELCATKVMRTWPVQSM